jgi:hypothetical protein
MKTTTQAARATGVVPQVIYAKPQWGSFETTDDPYELPLANSLAESSLSAGTRNVSLDNIYSIADLEAILRPYDADSMLLPLRLSALLGSASEESRLKITTTAWDTTMITGTAATKLSAWLRTLTGSISGRTALAGIVCGEISRGERFNLGRPLTGAKPIAYSAGSLYYVQRQAYFKDLYTLLVALGQPENATTAQWAANVVEFRDADSTMTPFEYDTNISNGWTVDNDASTKNDSERAVVWGSERPEILITHTSAWEDATTGELFIGLHRPWNAVALGPETTAIPAEAIDTAFDDATTAEPLNVLDLGRKSNRKAFADTAVYPIWRIRIVDEDGNTRYCRFDTDSSVSDSFTSTDITSASETPKMSTDAWLCIQGSNTQGAVVDPEFSNTTLSGLRVPGNAKAAGTNRSCIIYLERLSDPESEVTAAIWNQDPSTSDTVPMYRIVDKASVQVVNRTADPVSGIIPPTQITSVLRRKSTGSSALWKIDPPCPSPDSGFAVQAPVVIAPPALSSNPSNNPAWFVWPNRPFVSAAELFLVPTGDAITMLTHYQPATTGAIGLASLNCPELLDAVSVPTRYCGVHDTLDTAYSEGLGYYAGIFGETAPVNQLSAFREPGRVNINTITNNDVWNAVVAGPLTITGTATNKGAPEPIVSRSTAGFDIQPARSFKDLLALSGSASVSAPPAQDVELEDRNGNGILDPGEDLNGNGTLDAVRLPKTLNPAHAFFTANRLANVATIRSNVFAVWITVRSVVDADPDSVTLHRAFYIVDRSIPVGFQNGKDHNVWDAVILRRIIE